MSYTWPYQSTPYLSALPGVAGPGLDVSAGDLPSKLYFITSYADTDEGEEDPRGPNCFSGTARYCWGADQGEGFHKYVLPLIGGYVNLSSDDATSQGLTPAALLLPESPGRLRNGAYSIQWWLFAAFTLFMAFRMARDIGLSVPEVVEITPDHPVEPT